MAHDPYNAISQPLRWSVAIHIIIVLAVIFGLPDLWKSPPPPQPKEIVVDLVTPDEITAAPNTAKKEAEKKPERAPDKEPKPAPEKKAETPPKKPAEAPKPKAAPQSKGAENLKTPPPVKPRPPQEKLEEVPSTKADIKTETPPEEKETTDKVAPPPSEEFTSVLKNLVAEEEESAEPPVPEENVDAPVVKDQPAGKAPIQSQTLSISEVDALKRQLARCWNIPIGAVQAEDLTVEIDATVGPDRMVQQAKIVDIKRYESDPFFRAAAESARRALLSSACSPLALPTEKYHLWKEMRIRFDPREMFGG